MSTDVRRQNTLSMRVAAEIRAEMGRQQISGRMLARKLSRSPNWVSLKTSGAQRIDLDDLALIAEALGVAVFDLFPPRDRQPTVTTARRPPNRHGRSGPPNRCEPVRPPFVGAAAA